MDDINFDVNEEVLLVKKNNNTTVTNYQVLRPLFCFTADVGISNEDDNSDYKKERRDTV